MNTRFPHLVAAAAGLVALLALFSAMDFWRATQDYNRTNPDPYRIGYQPRRFAKAAQETPEDAVLGYISDLDFGELHGSTAFFAAQYALTPRILVPWQSEFAKDLVLGSFARLPDVEQVAAENGLTVVRDLGEGVVLFRKGESQ